MVHSNPGQPQGGSDRAFEPAGNRPAQNARQATPGSVLSQTKFPSQAATDFLGLEEQVAPAQGTTPSELFAEPEPVPELAAAEEDGEPAHESWVEDEGSTEVGDAEADTDEAESGAVHRSWVDDSPAVRSRSMLPKVAVALGLGMAGMTGFLVMKGGGSFDETVPLSPDMNGTPGYEERLLEGAPSAARAAGLPVSEESEELPGGEQLAVLTEPSALDAGVEPSELDASELAPEIEVAADFGEGLVVAQGEPPEETLAADTLDPGALDGGSVADADAGSSVEGFAEHSATTRVAVEPLSTALSTRRASLRPVWEVTGETPPPGALSSFAIEFAEEPAGETAAVAEVTALVVVGDDDGESSFEDHPYWQAAAEEPLQEPPQDSIEVAEPEPAEATLAAGFEEPVELVQGTAADPGEAAPSAPGSTSAEPIAETPEPAGIAQVSPSVPLTGGEAGFFGPMLPAGAASAVPLASVEEQEVTSNVRVRRLDPSQVVEPDQRGPRLATASELKGVWLEAEVPPMWTLDEPQKVLTPQVGQVRVILEGNEIFQGRLYAMGEGRVWINNERFGQMALDGVKVQKIVRIDGDDDTPLPGQNGSQDLGGLEAVRVKTPGGILLGKVIARDEQHTTIVTEDGTRVTLASDQVEFLNEAPVVALKRAGEPAAQSEPAAEPAEPSAPRVDEPESEPEGESPSEPRDAPVQTEPVPVKRP